MTTTADLAAGWILIRPAVTTILRVAKIPGATWDRRKQSYALRATRANAALIRVWIPAICVTAAFSAFETTKPEPPRIPPLPIPQRQTPALQSPDACEIPIRVPAGLRIQPWKHQLEGYRFAMRSLGEFHAALLAAQMGCGKSLVATMIALGIDAKMILVVCPLRVIGSWRDQLEQYLSGPFISAPLVDDLGTVPKRVEFAASRLALARSTSSRYFALVNYDVLWRPAMAEWLLGQTWDLVVYDESHRIKSVGGRASMFAKRFLPCAANRVLATGTPLAHSQLDIFSQFRAIAPSVFGPHYGPFKAKYAQMGGPTKGWIVGYRNQADLETKMAPLTWRCTKREVLPDLPDEMDVEFSTELSAEATRIYRQLERDMITQVEGHTLTAANCLTKVLRLQQLTGGSLKTDDGGYHNVDDGKRKLLADTLEDLGDQPMVIFCRFRSDIDAAHEACRCALPARQDKGPVSLELSGQRNELERWLMDL